MTDISPTRPRVSRKSALSAPTMTGARRGSQGWAPSLITARRNGFTRESLASAGRKPVDGAGRPRWDAGMGQLHDDEADTGLDTVRALLDGQRPDLAGRPVVPLGEDSTGTDNVLYRLGDDLVVRLPAPRRRRRAWSPRPVCCQSSSAGCRSTSPPRSTSAHPVRVIRIPGRSCLAPVSTPGRPGRAHR